MLLDKQILDDDAVSLSTLEELALLLSGHDQRRISVQSLGRMACTVSTDLNIDETATLKTSGMSDIYSIIIAIASGSAEFESESTMVIRRLVGLDS